MKKTILVLVILFLPCVANAQEEVRVKLGCFDGGTATIRVEMTGVEGDVVFEVRRGEAVISRSTQPVTGGEMELSAPGAGSCLKEPCMASILFTTGLTGEDTPTKIEGAAVAERSDVPQGWPNPIVVGTCS